MSHLFDKVLIVGIGLIGGSLALVLKRRGIAREVLGVDLDPGNLEKAKALGMVDSIHTDPCQPALEADLVVLATPVGAIPVVALKMAPHLREGTILTDVGSVKGPVVKALEGALPPGMAIVGGHPIAGRERSGVEAALVDLFQGAKCVLTPTPQTDQVALGRIKALWETMGSEVILMTPELHDQIFAAVSHLPHVVAYSLIGALLDLDNGTTYLSDFAAGGLKDFTRIAMSHPAMWRDICLLNREEILAMLGRFRKALDRLEHLIKQGDGPGLYQAFERAKMAREGL
ncbi:MAG: prephenate dehydrogenase/arogenate dehydrogenase family protein [candidate division NC10 bacterium]|nr:prephenate dehydrogenase/arogenate dehydrogenase family protein [candidate division NC10 bacterium]